MTRAEKTAPCLSDLGCRATKIAPKFADRGEEGPSSAPHPLKLGDDISQAPRGSHVGGAAGLSVAVAGPTAAVIRQRLASLHTRSNCHLAAALLTTPPFRHFATFR